MIQVDPHSNEVRYSMSLVGYQVAALAPRSVRIASTSPELVTAAVRYLNCGGHSLIVETTRLQALVAERLGISVDVFDPAGPPADCAVLPFSIEDGARPAGEASIVVAYHNALSYKTLLRPGHVRGTSAATISRLAQGYRVQAAGGLFSPLFVVLLALAKLAESFSPALYFRLEGLAMCRLVDLGSLWRLSYVVVLVGRRII